MTFWLGLFLTSALDAHATPPPASEDARRIVAILDYVTSDYGGAVRDGAVLSANEYAEQEGFVADAARLAATLPSSDLDVASGIATLQQDVASLVPSAVVAQDAAALRAGLVRAYGVSLVPAAPVSREVGAALYATSCASCHGVDGGADTETAHRLTPPPRNFRDPEVMSMLTPARAFNALADGVAGTAMPSFAQLPLSDRWSLAFYVFTLRFDAAAEARGAGSGRTVDVDIATLAGASDADLAGRILNSNPSEQADAVAWLRGVAAYPEQGRSMAAARSGIDDAMTAFRAGDRAEAGHRLTDAYLRGFEPHEAILRQTMPEVVTRVEEGFLGLRAAIDAGAPADEVLDRAVAIRASLDDAESGVSSAGGNSVAFAGGFLVFLREGVEAALLVLLLLGYARTRGSREVRWVHAGWLSAILAGVATWAASSWLVGIAGAQREAVEGFTAILAALFMVSAHHWLASRADAARRVGAIRAVMGTGVLAWWTLPALAFGAVYREAFEVVLFLQAIILDSSASPWAVAAGCVAATACLVIAVAVLLRAGGRLPIGPLLTAASVLLCVMAVIFAGKGTHALQEAGFIGVAIIALPRVEWLGIFPSWQTVGAQVALSFMLALSAALPKLKSASNTDGMVAAPRE